MTQASSAMSITQLCNVEEQKDEIQQEGKFGSTNKEAHVLINNKDQHFIRRLPLVHSALKAYENSSSVVKYGAEMIESYAGPIYDKLGYDRKLKEVTRITHTCTQAFF